MKKEKQNLTTALVFIFIFIVVSICFLIGEKLQMWKPINHEKFASYFTSIGAIGTAFSLFLLYKQTRLMYASTVTQYKPHLIIKPVKFIIQINENKPEGFELVQNGSMVKSIIVPFLNIGNGLARNVVILMDYLYAEEDLPKLWDRPDLVPYLLHVPVLFFNETCNLELTNPLQNSHFLKLANMDFERTKNIDKFCRIEISFSDNLGEREEIVMEGSLYMVKHFEEKNIELSMFFSQMGIG